jgi:hypothetical protein
MNADIQGITAVKRASAPADPTAVAPIRPVAGSTDEPPASRQPAVPQQSIPSTASALPLAETALRRVLASQGPSGVENPTATALDLLRSVEALLQASAPAGTSPEEIGAAAARLVERQGLLARIGDAGTGVQSAASPAGDAWSGATADDGRPSAVDTRL